MACAVTAAIDGGLFSSCKSGDVIKLVCRAGEYLGEQYDSTRQHQAHMHEGKTGRALALTHTEKHQVKADCYGCAEKQNGGK